MAKEKTALQKAIEDIKGYGAFGDVINIKFAAALLRTYLEKERDQIVDAWCAGIENEPMSKIHGEKYFNKKYVGRIK
jgi:hypothetical protein